MQGHSHGDTFDAGVVQRSLDKLAALKLPIRITEFNFPGQHSKHYQQRGARLTEEEEGAKARAMVDYLRLCFAHPAVEGVLFWGFWEGANWIPVSSLYRRDWSPTPAGEAYRDLVYREWWTRASGKTDGQGRWEVKAFYGEHRVTVGAETRSVELRRKEGKRVVVAGGA